MKIRYMSLLAVIVQLASITVFAQAPSAPATTATPGITVGDLLDNGKLPPDLAAFVEKCTPAMLSWDAVKVTRVIKDTEEKMKYWDQMNDTIAQAPPESVPKEAREQYNKSSEAYKEAVKNMELMKRLSEFMNNLKLVLNMSSEEFAKLIQNGRMEFMYMLYLNMDYNTSSPLRKLWWVLDETGIKDLAEASVAGLKLSEIICAAKTLGSGLTGGTAVMGKWLFDKLADEFVKDKLRSMDMSFVGNDCLKDMNSAYNRINWRDIDRLPSDEQKMARLKELSANLFKPGTMTEAVFGRYWHRVSVNENMSEYIVQSMYNLHQGEKSFKFQSFVAKCPVKLHLYDKEGRHTGPTVAGGVELGIPGSFYYAESATAPHRTGVIGECKDLRLEIEGAGDGTCTVSTIEFDGSESSVVNGARFNGFKVAAGSKSVVERTGSAAQTSLKTGSDAKAINATVEKTDSAAVKEAGGGRIGSGKAPQVALFDNWNKEATSAGPKEETTFVVEKAARVGRIATCHAKGMAPGMISLQDEAGKTYGPWKAEAPAAGAGVAGSVWVCKPNTDLPAGKYNIVDSDKATWLCNAGSGNAGIAVVESSAQGPGAGSTIVETPTSGSTSTGGTGAGTDIPEGWVPVAFGNVTVAVPSDWQAIPGTPADEGGWFKGDKEKPDLSFGIVRQQKTEELLKRFKIEKKEAFVVDGRAATKYTGLIDEDPKAKPHGIVVVLKDPEPDGKFITFMVAGIDAKWMENQLIVEKLISLVRIGGGSGVKDSTVETVDIIKKSAPATMPAPGSGGGVVFTQTGIKTPLLIALILLGATVLVLALAIAAIQKRRVAGAVEDGISIQASLQVSYATGGTKVFRIKETRTTIGRGEDNHLVVKDPKVSTHHAEIIVSREGFLIKDLGSANMTMINGRPVTEAYIQLGDEIGIGTTRIVLGD